MNDPQHPYPSERVSRASQPHSRTSTTHLPAGDANDASISLLQCPRHVPVLAPFQPSERPLLPTRQFPTYIHDRSTPASTSSAESPIELASTPAHELPKARKRATVLIVEHEFNNRMLMESILDLGGYRCITASNGQEALHLFEVERPDLILTDISMPVMDGLVATAVLRERPEGKHIPIVAVSGHALREDREHALRQGCTEYLVKPYRPHDLLTLVERLLETSRGRV